MDKSLFASQSLNKYINFMTKFLHQAKRILKDNGNAVLIISDVKELNLAEKVWEKNAKPTGFVKQHLLIDEIAENSKTTKIWNERKGRATKIDKILVLSKN